MSEQTTGGLPLIESAAVERFHYHCFYLTKKGGTMLRRLLIDWRPLVAFVGLFAAFGLAGCGGGGGGVARPKTVKVTGKVVYKGQPVAGASVAFLGDGSSTPALGRTDAEGRFELTTFDAGDGAVVGTHKVTVAKIVPPKSASTSTGIGSMEAAAKKASERGNEMPSEDAGTLSLLPEKYAQAATTDLSFEVKSSGTNDFTIEL